MIVRKQKSEEGHYDLFFEEESKVLGIIFAGNLDLYWYFIDKDNFSERNGTFKITKENYFIYSLFEELYNSIKESDVFKVTDVDLMFCKSLKDLEEESNLKESLNKRAKQVGNYDELFHDDMVTWVSDDCKMDEVNSVDIMKKDDDEFILNFVFTSKFPARSIRFRNSRSYYDPYNCLFMKMFQELQKYDPLDGQIHIEEYLYDKKRLRK